MCCRKFSTKTLKYMGREEYYAATDDATYRGKISFKRKNKNDRLQPF